jgi:signal transduction histidine kinase
VFVLCLAISAIAAMGYAVSRANQHDELVATRAEAISATLAVMIYDAGAHASAVTALFHASIHVTEPEFDSFVEEIGLTEGMFGMGFVAAVDQSELARFEAELGRNHPGAFVFEVEEGRQIAVGARETYYPVQFFSSAENLPAWGFDAGSDPEFAAAIERTLKTGRLSASGFLTFAGSFPEGWVISQPVFRADGSVRGVVATAMDLESVLAAALPSGLEDDLELTIHDLSGGAPSIPEGAWSETVRAANRTWRVDIVPIDNPTSLWNAMLIIGAGIVTGAALAAAVLAVGARLRQQREVEEMRSLNRQKDDFLATVSHELRTPLTSIMGFADALAGLEFTPGERAEMMGYIGDEAKAMEGIVQDLLAVARLQQGGAVPISLESVVDLGAEIGRISSQMSAVRDVPVTVAGNAATFADPARVRQIMRNLLDNAVRHGRPPITVVIERDGAMVRIRVRDDGDGVAPAMSRGLFDRYRSGPNPEGLPTSTGIGLWLSRELASLMGGDLRFVPSGGGATFELTLPASPAEAADTPVEALAS